MIKTVRDAWQIPELRRKILFTIFALLIFRLGAAIPVPYINTSGLETYLSAQSGTILGLMNAMSGSAFSMATLFALSIQPYINSSIIIQLLTVAIPALERMSREGGEEGKRKIKAITRYATVAIAVLQALGYYFLMRNNTTAGFAILTDTGVWAALVIMVSFVAGSSFLMWLGEQCNEFGVGNGISMILFAGIISRVPAMVSSLYSSIVSGTMHWAWTILIVVGILLLVVLIVFVSDAERRIPVQYAKRQVGRRMYGGQSSSLPMKVNMSGVLPIIFAQSIASLPATIAAFLPAPAEGTFWYALLQAIDTQSVLYMIVYFLMIIGFSYFYATIQFNPIEIANNLKKNGGFVPGFRPGKPTADFLARVINRLTMFGAIYLAVVALLPAITGNIMLAFGSSAGNSLAIGGTSIIIVVGVALETVKVLEAQLMMRHYKGFLE